MKLPRQSRNPRTLSKNSVTDPEKSIRAFFAVDIVPVLKERLKAMQSRLKPCFEDLDVNWVRMEHLHLTLRFLGNISREQLSLIINNCGFIASYPAQTLSVSGVGCFPSAAKPRVIWAGCRLQDDLYVLQKKIENAVQSAGIEPETRIFSPHLTLGRVRDFTSRRNRPVNIDLKSIQDELGAVEGESEQSVNGIRLYQSHLSPKGPEYTILHEFHFSS